MYKNKKPNGFLSSSEWLREFFRMNAQNALLHQVQLFPEQMKFLQMLLGNQNPFQN